MAKRHRRNLVVDADVARSAGESKHSISSACRRFLDTMSEVGHSVVMTKAIGEEWRRHRSGYSATWLTRMYGKKQVYRAAIEPDAYLRHRVNNVVTGHQRNAAAKDVHLIEAALGTDRLVASQDERARAAFRNAARGARELNPIVWVNPTRWTENPIDWLRNGAKAEDCRQLGL